MSADDRAAAPGAARRSLAMQTDFILGTASTVIMVVTVTVIAIPTSVATTAVEMVMAAAIPTRRNKRAAALPGDGSIIRSVITEVCHEAVFSRRVNADG